MVETLDAKYVDHVFDLAVESADAHLEGVEEALGLKASGMGNPSDAQLAAFFFQMQQLFPPEPWIMPADVCPQCQGMGETPEGLCALCGGLGGFKVTTACPWILSLGFTENGIDWLRRFDRFTAKAGAL